MFYRQPCLITRAKMPSEQMFVELILTLCGAPLNCKQKVSLRHDRFQKLVFADCSCPKLTLKAFSGILKRDKNTHVFKYKPYKKILLDSKNLRLSVLKALLVSFKLKLF